MSPRGKTKANPRAIAVASLAFILMAALWILLVAGLKRDEMIVGAASVAASAVFLFAVHRAGTLDLRFRLADVAQGWVIPGQLVQRNWQITVLLLKDLLGIKRAQSLFRVAAFKTGKKDPVFAARRVLATLYTTAAPNFIVIGIDSTQGRMLFHQIERGEISSMTKKLGAHP